MILILLNHRNGSLGRLALLQNKVFCLYYLLFLSDGGDARCWFWITFHQSWRSSVFASCWNGQRCICLLCLLLSQILVNKRRCFLVRTAMVFNVSNKLSNMWHHLWLQNASLWVFLARLANHGCPCSSRGLGTNTLIGRNLLKVENWP